MRKRLLSILLALCMALTLLPAAALAEESGEDEEGGSQERLALVLDAGVNDSADSAPYWADLLFTDGTSSSYAATDKPCGGLIGQWVSCRWDDQGILTLEEIPQDSVSNMQAEDHTAVLPKNGTADYAFASTVTLDGASFPLTPATTIIVKTETGGCITVTGRIPNISGGKVLYSFTERGDGFLYVDASAATVIRPAQDIFLVANSYTRLSDDGNNRYYSFRGVVDGIISNRIKLKWESQQPDEATQKVINRLLQGNGNDVLLRGFRFEAGLYTVNLDNWVRPSFGTGRVFSAGDAVESVTAEGITIGGETYSFAEGCKFFRTDGSATNTRIVESTWRGISKGLIGADGRYAFMGLTLNGDGAVSALYWRMPHGEVSYLPHPPEPDEPEFPVIPEWPAVPEDPEAPEAKPTVKLDKPTAQVRVGGTVRINVTITPPAGGDLSGYGYVWDCDDLSVAEFVESGPNSDGGQYAVVKGLKPGKTVLYFEVVDENGEVCTDFCELTVLKEASSGSSGGSSGGGDSKPSKKPNPAKPGGPATPAPGTTPSVPSGGGGFHDVPSGFWAGSQIAWAAEKGIMGGYGGGEFAPDRNVTRQQLWMVLGRLNGTAPSNMAAAQAWAVQNGVSDGSGASGTMSRQQMVTMLYRYAQQMGYATSARADLGQFPDNANVAGYAKEALSWAVASGVMGGTSSGTLNPGGTASRAHFAVFMHRFCTLYQIA